MENKELSLEELSKVLAGANPEVAIDKASENEDLYRKEQIEFLKQQKANLKNRKEKDSTEEKGFKM